jgi:hypothetical protein
MLSVASRMVLRSRLDAILAQQVFDVGLHLAGVAIDLITLASFIFIPSTSIACCFDICASRMSFSFKPESVKILCDLIHVLV